VLAPPLAAPPPIFVNHIRRIGEASIMENEEARFGQFRGPLKDLRRNDNDNLERAERQEFDFRAGSI
jgi:hypothetical protein